MAVTETVIGCKSLVCEIAAIWRCQLTPAGNIRGQCEVLLGQWIKTAQNDVSSEVKDKEINVI